MSFYLLQMYIYSLNKPTRWPICQSQVLISKTLIGTKIKSQVLNSSSSMGFPNLFHRFSNSEPLLGTPLSRLGTSCLRFQSPKPISWGSRPDL